MRSSSGCVSGAPEGRRWGSHGAGGRRRGWQPGGPSRGPAPVPGSLSGLGSKRAIGLCISCHPRPSLVRCMDGMALLPLSVQSVCPSRLCLLLLFAKHTAETQPMLEMAAPFLSASMGTIRALEIGHQTFSLPERARLLHGLVLPVPNRPQETGLEMMSAVCTPFSDCIRINIWLIMINIFGRKVCTAQFLARTSACRPASADYGRILGETELRTEVLERQHSPPPATRIQIGIGLAEYVTQHYQTDLRDFQNTVAACSLKLARSVSTWAFRKAGSAARMRASALSMICSSDKGSSDAA